MNVELNNGILKAELTDTGGKLLRLSKEGRDYLWNADPAYWDDVAPVLFPFCGRCRNGEYFYKGKQYPMTIHGFLPSLKADSVVYDETSAEFVFCSDEKTLEIYPFDFRLKISYSLIGSSVDIKIHVETMSDHMYYSVGFHPGFRADGERRIVFDSECRPSQLEITSEGLLGTLTKHYKDTPVREISLDVPEVSGCGLFLKDCCNGLTLLDCQKMIAKIKTASFPVLGFWTAPGSGFICVEPWAGLPAIAGEDTVLDVKPMVRRIEKGESEEFDCSIELI